MGKWTKQEMKRTQWPGRWQQMVASCKDAQESKRLCPSVTVSSTAQLWGDVPAPSAPSPASRHSAYHLQGGGQRLVNERRTRDRGTQGPPLLRLLRVASPLWLPNEQEMDASASCPGTEFTMHPMSLTATCSTAIKAVREKLIFNQ